MNNQFEALAGLIRNNPNGMKIAANIGKLKQILDTPQGRKMAAELANSGNDVIKQAAEAALANDKQRAMQLISSVLSTPEGKKAAAEIISMLGE